MHAALDRATDSVEAGPNISDTSATFDAHAQAALAALGQQTRLRIFRLLTRNEPSGITVGAIAQAIQCPQNTTSSHLAILARAQLAISVRQGRSVLYRADFAGMRRLIEYLLDDCCNGDASLCAPLFSALCAGKRSNSRADEPFR